MNTSLVTRRQRGGAAVELAVLLPIIFVMLTFPIFFGRYFWHYTVAHKAAHDAARYLSTISEAEMRTETLARAAEEVAHGIALEEIADLNPGLDSPNITVLCGARAECSGVAAGALPQTVLVKVEINMFDTIFRVIPTNLRGMPITATAEVPYVGQ